MPRNEQVSRRGLVARLMIAGAAGLTAYKAGDALAAASDLPRVVYHLADRDKVQFVLGNIANHFEGVGGPSKIQIALVVHGPALMEFQSVKATPDLKARFGRLVGEGLKPGACGNTLAAQKLAVTDLVPGFELVKEGGVVRLAELQRQGWAYLRP